MSRVQTVHALCGDGTPSHEEVREELHSLLKRDEFNASERNRRFLSYVVEETLQGRAERIKAYSIAITAFDRTDDFDPLTDPIVRIEASRLRRSLEYYYLTAGRADRVRIEMPKGSYSATFKYHDPAPATPAPISPGAEPPAAAHAPTRVVPAAPRRWSPRAWVVIMALGVLVAMLAGIQAWQHLRASHPASPSLGPSVVVLPFENFGNDPQQDFIARGLTFEIINSLTRYSDLFVLGPETSFALDRRDPRVLTFDSVKADYILSGSVHSMNGALRVSVILSNFHTGRSVWSSDFSRSLTAENLLTIQSDVADQVARAIGQPYGAVFNLTADQIASKSFDSLESYECVVRFRQRWRDYDQRDFEPMRTCLERAIETDPGYARAYASLALLYVDSYRFGFGSDEVTGDPLERAIELAQRSLELDPDGSDGYLALSMAYWFSHDPEASIATAKRGLALDPHNPDLLAELGFRYAFLEQWDLSRPLIAEAFARNPAAPSGYRIANFLYYYAHGDYEAALNEALQVKARYILYGYICRAMAYAELGDKADAEASLAEVLKIDPKYGEHIRADLAKRGITPHFIQATVDSLSKAGLHVPPVAQ
jgi:adenylate cyclase